MRGDRAAFFVDGNNWFHGCRALGLANLGRLNFARAFTKLAGERRWTSARYYVGRVTASGDTKLAVAQRKFINQLQAQDQRISVHWGRLEPRAQPDAAAVALRRYLAGLQTRIEPSVYHDLLQIAQHHWRVVVMVEKAVDVGIAVDMVVMSERNEYDVAYLLSADGDLSPAVEAVRATGREVFVATPSRGSRLAAVASRYLWLRKDWFSGLFDGPSTA